MPAVADIWLKSLNCPGAATPPSSSVSKPGKGKKRSYSLCREGNLLPPLPGHAKLEFNHKFSALRKKGLIILSMGTLTRTAADTSSEVNKVEVSFNGGPWQLATGATSWSYIPRRWDLHDPGVGDRQRRQCPNDPASVTISVKIKNKSKAK